VQEHLLRWGLDGLGEPPAPAETPTVQDLLRSL
jgi:hypothetical protein